MQNWLGIASVLVAGLALGWLLGSHHNESVVVTANPPVSTDLHPKVPLRAPSRTARRTLSTRPRTATPEMGPIIPEDVAQMALNDVGVDADAMGIWLEAINDQNMPAASRRKLIEGLGVTGISDVEHPTEADGTLIDSRLAMIDQLSPNAMDDVNLAAFEQAKRDLTRIRALVPAAETPAIAPPAQ